MSLRVPSWGRGTCGEDGGGGVCARQSQPVTGDSVGRDGKEGREGGEGGSRGQTGFLIFW